MADEFEDWKEATSEFLVECQESAVLERLRGVIQRSLLALENLKRPERPLKDFDEAISTSLDAYEMLESFGSADGEKAGGNLLRKVTTLLSVLYYRRAANFPSSKHDKKAVEFQTQAVASQDTGGGDPVPRVRHTSLFAAMLAGQHERLAYTLDNHGMQEALSYSCYSIRYLQKYLTRPDEFSDFPQYTAPRRFKSPFDAAAEHESSINSGRLLWAAKQTTSVIIDICATHSTVLLSHFQATSDSRSLSEALAYSTAVVECFNSAPTETSEFVEEWPVRFCNHGRILEAQYQRDRFSKRRSALKALSEAICYGERALKQMNENSGRKAGVLILIANWLCNKWESTKDLRLVENATQKLDEAYSLQESDKGEISFSKSIILGIQYRISKTASRTNEALKYLDEAISEGERAIEKLTENDSRLGKWHKNVAEMQRMKLLDTNSADKHLRAQSKRNFAIAAEAKNASFSVRLSAALGGGLLLIEDEAMEEAHKIFQCAIEQFLAFENSFVLPRDLQENFRQASSLAEHAASVALQVGDPPFVALRSLELSRCIISRLSRKTKVDLSNLYKVDETLARRYSSARSDLERERRLIQPHYIFKPNEDMWLTDLMGLTEDIQQLDAFKNFQQPLTEAEMKLTASEGPVVVVNVSTVSSDAIIVTIDKIVRLNLPKMGYKDTRDKILILDVLISRKQRDFARRNAHRPASTIAAALDALSWLWEVAVREILKNLPRSTRRVWWITTGLADRLPFHAAGDHTPDSKNNTLNCVMSSYVSSFQTLQYARERAKCTSAITERNSPKKMFLVTVTNDPDSYGYLNTGAEVAAVQKFFKPALQDEEQFFHLESPSPASVLHFLRRYSFVHFACHGVSNGQDPTQSGLLLVGDQGEGEMLTIADIESRQTKEHQPGEVAYLSACSTAKIQQDDTLAGEAIHLGNLFQTLGFPHVIATLYGANDETAGEVADAFYEDLMREADGIPGDGDSVCLDVVGALHRATKKVRNNLEGEHVLDWVPFVHIGP
ncbi:hypothetical protein FOPE_05666 [Fonsecaea pedrosoi]|nr:hypothetical protein FOPE_05666 [Fonsecaea pedrosoi]